MSGSFSPFHCSQMLLASLPESLKKGDYFNYESSTLEEVINTLTSKQKSHRQSCKNGMVDIQWWVKNTF